MSLPRRIAAPLLAACLVCALPARAEWGGTLALLSDGQERGVSYSDGRPQAVLGLAWDGSQGRYAGLQLTHSRFWGDRRSAWLQAYAGQVVELTPGLDAEAGLRVHRFPSLGHYDFAEAYVGLLAERWQLRLHHAPDYYGLAQRTWYAELNGRWPLAAGLAATGHVGVAAVQGRGRAREDLRLGLSRTLGESAELQLAWVAVGRGGPSSWTDPPRRRQWLASVSLGF
ncbi:MAG TPA: TorF family putative porin [Roseateles sp.]